MKTIEFFVHGEPKPSGSKRGFYVAKLKRVVITDDNKRSRDWKTDVQQSAIAHRNGGLLEGALKLTVVFFVLRPKSHYRTGNYSAILRDNAPDFPCKKPDCTKLVRCVEDALNQVLWRDDSQVVTQSITKRYGNEPGALVRISEEVL